MTQAAATVITSDFEQTSTIDEWHPEHAKGKEFFSQVKSYLDEIGVSYNKLSKKCVSFTSVNGNDVFLRVYFNNAGGWGGASEYSLGLYSERRSTVAVRHNDVSILMTTNRGAGNFEEHFPGYLSELLERPVTSLKFKP